MNWKRVDTTTCSILHFLAVRIANCRTLVHQHRLTTERAKLDRCQDPFEFSHFQQQRHTPAVQFDSTTSFQPLTYSSSVVHRCTHLRNRTAVKGSVVATLWRQSRTCASISSTHTYTTAANQIVARRPLTWLQEAHPLHGDDQGVFNRSAVEADSGRPCRSRHQLLGELVHA